MPENKLYNPFAGHRNDLRQPAGSGQVEPEMVSPEHLIAEFEIEVERLRSALLRVVDVPLNGLGDFIKEALNAVSPQGVVVEQRKRNEVDSHAR